MQKKKQFRKITANEQTDNQPEVIVLNNQNESDSDEEQVFTPMSFAKKVFTWLVKTAFLVGLYIYFWDNVWIRWTLLITIPIQLLSLARLGVLGMIFRIQSNLRNEFKQEGKEGKFYIVVDNSSKKEHT